MSAHKSKSARLLGGAALFTLATCGAAYAEARATFDIPAQSLAAALSDFTAQSHTPILAKPELLVGKRSRGATGATDPASALSRVLEGTGLTYQRSGQTYLIVADVRTATRIEATFAPETVTGSAIDGLVVTAQKRREQIQDVPIAISAFSADALQAQKIEGGFDLLKAIPNVTFSKNNFSSYNFSIRGIGTKAISVTTDPGVAVEFNDTPLIRNRLFEQEYFDVERVEVLRGPQGTLHGRNATAGVINVISNKADLDAFDGKLKGEVGNYHTKRLSGFVNVPLIEDVLAARFAGAMTAREGYDYNETTQHAINGRDLWSGRLTIGFQPTDNLRADFIWERFNEDDDRSRTGKQLCHHDDGAASIGSITNLDPIVRGHLSQGCKPGSLYDPAAFGTPNGLSIPFIQIATDASFITLGTRNGAWITPILEGVDPYGGLMQSPDLRRINSVRDPIYRASTDLLELSVSWDVSPSLTFSSLTAYSDDEIYSFQDYNRFNTVPIFENSSELDVAANGIDFSELTPGGIYCDPQIGCADSIAGFDVSQAKSKQFSQEFRLQSNFEGPWNFSVGANYTRYTTIEDYYVFYNLITLVAQSGGGITLFNSSVDPTKCIPKGGFIFNGKPVGFGNAGLPAVPIDSPEGAGCIYIDPNPIESIDGDGHNYFRSKNPYKLQSKAAFGELYWQATDTVKVTAGLRYTDDEKTFTPVPSQILLANSWFLFGTVDKGYPALPDIEQQWGEFSGRLGVDWKPDFSFTDETLLYAFYSRGYKGGGANPPGIGYTTDESLFGMPLAQVLPYPKTFDPEFVDAFEVGAKNTLMGGSMTLNVGAFYYDYRDYQVSQIKERTAVNENFDATVWGLEMESLFAPNEDLRFNFSMGYQDTSIADGEESLDLMNRTQGDPNLILVKPYVIRSSNCVVPVDALEDFFGPNGYYATLNEVCGGFLALPLNPLNGPNGGAGLFADLGGNELPNAPHFTVSIGGEYGWDLFDGNWRANVRADGYWQSQSWARVYNLDPYDKLHGWYNANLSFWVEKPEEDLRIEFYVKNLLDDTPITDAFLNSDDTALSTNIFTLDPRLIGLQITKGF